MQKCLKNGNNIMVCTSLIQTMMLLYIVIILIVWYVENKPAIDAMSFHGYLLLQQILFVIESYDTKELLTMQHILLIWYIKW